MQLSRVDPVYFQKETPSTNLGVLKAQGKGLTRRAQNSAEEIKNSSVGIFHRIRKVFARTATHGAILGAPVAGISLGAFLYDRPSVQDFFARFFAIGSLSLLSAKATDFVFFKLLGIEPIKACAILVFEVYRKFASSVANEVARGYDLKETNLNKAQEKAKEDLSEELTSVYKKMAEKISDLSQEDKEHLLKNSLPQAQKELQRLGLSPYQAKQVIEPLKSALIKSLPSKNKPSSASSQLSLLSRVFHRSAQAQ